MIIIKDIFTNEQREILIKECQPMLIDMGERYPGKQSLPTLHIHPDFIWAHKVLLNRIKEKTGWDMEIEKSWINYTDGKETCWHSHPGCDYASVYYLSTIPFLNSGTLFEDGFYRSPQNSIIIFPSATQHAMPTYPFPYFKRYSLAMDLNILT